MVVHHVSCVLGGYQGTCVLWYVCWVGSRGPVYCGCTSRFMCVGWVAGDLFIVVVHHVSCVLGGYQGTCVLWYVCWVGSRGPVYCGCTSRFMYVG